MKPATLRSWFTWWIVLVFPMCPMEVYVHVMAFITIADILLMCRGSRQPSQILWQIIIARNVLMSACRCLRDNARVLKWRRVSHGYKYYESDTLVVDIYGILECFTMRRFYHDAFSCCISSCDLDDTLFEAELFLKRVLISIPAGSHY